jgi:hypothetical protein
MEIMGSSLPQFYTMNRPLLLIGLIALCLACGGGGGGAANPSAGEALVQQVNINTTSTKVELSGNLLGSQTISESDKDVDINQETNIGTGAQVVIQSKALDVQKPLEIADGASLEVQAETVEVQEELTIEGELVIQ